MNRVNTFESLESRVLLSASPVAVHGSTRIGDGPAVTLPATPTKLTDVVSGQSVKLQWTDNSSNETGFVIQRYTGGKTGFVDIGTVAANVTTFTDTGAVVGTDAYIVRAVNTAGRSEGSNSVVATIAAPSPTPTPTPTPTPSPTTLTAPTNLTDVVSGQTVTLKWTDNSSNETGFVIQRYTGGKTGFVDIGTVAANVTTFTDTSAVVGYEAYMVRAVNTAGRSEGSNSVIATILAPTPIVTVTAPTHLSTAGASSISIAISWSGDAGATGGYRIERSLDGKTGWTVAGTTAAGVRTFSDTGRSAKVKYYYHVVAIGAGGQTATSAVIIGMTATGDGPRK